MVKVKEGKPVDFLFL